MEPTIQTSFIPKRPISTVAPEASHKQHQATGLLSVVTIIIILATIASYGWVYLDEKQLKSNLNDLSAAISKSRQDIGSTFVSEIQRLSMRIEGGKTLIDNHVVVSPIFSALQQTTLKTVQYKSFTYSLNGDVSTNGGSVQVELAGTAKSYATLALQSDEFTKNLLIIKNPVFSGLTIDDKTNRVDFKLTFTVNASDLSYDKFITSITPVPSQASPVIQPTQ